MLEIVILAAGASSRLGKSKQLLTINNEALISRAAKNACKLAEYFHLLEPVVIVGKDHQTVKALLQVLPVAVVYNSKWEDGMGLSIAAAVKHLKPETSAVLLMTCDQVLLDADILKPLIHFWQKNSQKIVASSYNEIIGVPVIFPQKFFPELAKLQSDKGARLLLQKYSEEVVTFDLPEAIQDLDTLDDERLIRELLE